MSKDPELPPGAHGGTVWITRTPVGGSGAGSSDGRPGRLRVRLVGAGSAGVMLVKADVLARAPLCGTGPALRDIMEVSSCFPEPAAIPAPALSKANHGEPHVPFRLRKRTRQAESSIHHRVTAELPGLHVPLDRIDGEDSRRQQLLALPALRRDVVSRSAEESAGAAVATMTARKAIAGETGRGRAVRELQELISALDCRVPSGPTRRRGGDCARWRGTPSCGLEADRRARGWPTALVIPRCLDAPVMERTIRRAGRK